jgi:hypothetical protein
MLFKFLSKGEFTMQSNTAEIGNRTFNFSSFSVEEKRCKCDPFTVRDGHYVGHDGFVVPKDFQEFYKRFPNYVHRWVIKHAGMSASQEDIEDWTQDLIIHLSCLPQKSKYCEAGKKDIVATFDALKHHGANEARFRNYINLCLANKFRTMHSKRMKDGLCRPGNFHFDGEKADEELLKKCPLVTLPFGSFQRHTQVRRMFVAKFIDEAEVSCTSWGGKTRRLCPPYRHSWRLARGAKRPIGWESRNSNLIACTLD